MATEDLSILIESSFRTTLEENARHRYVIFPQIAFAIGVLTSNRRGGWLPTLAEFTLGAIAGVPLLGAIVGCHGWMPLLGANASYQLWRSSRWVPLLGCHCWVPLREKIDQSVTPFSAAPFSTLITHKLACAIWGLCLYIFFFGLFLLWTRI